MCSLISLFGVGFAISKVLPPALNGTISLDGWRLDHFNKELFWEEPPEGSVTKKMYKMHLGLYEVDVGLR